MQYTTEIFSVTQWASQNMDESSVHNIYTKIYHVNIHKNVNMLHINKIGIKLSHDIHLQETVIMSQVELRYKV
jgi:hypothetical protein